MNMRLRRGQSLECWVRKKLLSALPSTATLAAPSILIELLVGFYRTNYDGFYEYYAYNRHTRFSGSRIFLADFKETINPRFTYL